MASAANTNIPRRKSKPELTEIPGIIRSGQVPLVPEESPSNGDNVPCTNGAVTPSAQKSSERVHSPSSKVRNTFDFGSFPQITHPKFRLKRSRSVDKGANDVIPPGDSVPTMEPNVPNKPSLAGIGDIPCTDPLKPSTQQTHNVPVSPAKVGSAGRDGAHQQANALRGKTCASCDRSFSVFRAKHTCKVCQERFCDDCSKNRFKLDLPFERKKGSRICDACARIVCTPLPREDACVQSDHVSEDMKTNRLRGTSHHVRGTHRGLVRSHKSCLVREKSQNALVIFYQGDPMSHLRPRHWRYFLVISILIISRHLMGILAHCPEEVASTHFNRLCAKIEDLLAEVASFRAVGLSFIFLVLFDEFCRKLGALNAPPARTIIPSGTMTNTCAKTVLQNDIHSPLAPNEEMDPIVKIEAQEAPRDGFDFDKLLHVLQGGCDPEMSADAFLSACNNLCEFIMVFGRATSFAASTVHGYIHSIESNLSNWSKDRADGAQCHWNRKSLKSIIEHEVHTNTATLGGKKKPSCSRCTLRLLWFIEFVEACIRYMFLEMAHESCSSAISKAYEETIGSRHPWIIRKGVFSALSAIPSRQHIINSLGLGTQSEEMAHSQIVQTQNAMKCMLDHVHSILQTHELMDLK
uniref:Uncharacterized protein AlNc14C130G6910 n=1 Tax=Albugo laibachii Nc14 TaxID=890382 RepID=F0WK59_9STRA|nr:conserved hypothetical protein [Albugo laibachii Nc14]|eukprot:CCA21661.1 conserved hypothetical protein [Albugo laibachii Nc14]